MMRWGNVLMAILWTAVGTLAAVDSNWTAIGPCVVLVGIYAERAIGGKA
jgi:hypothetical protein